MTLAELKGDIVILACAISAGIHGALVPDHFEDGAAAGLGFGAAAVALGLLAVWLTLRPASRLALGAAAAMFVGLLASYGFAVTTGVPLLHPETEPLDGLALVTKAFEAIGLAAASSLLWRPLAASLPQPKGTMR